MNLDDIKAQDNKVAKDKEIIEEMKNNMIKEYEELLELSDLLTKKVAIDKSYRDEVEKYFINNGFKKSDTNHEGHLVMSNNITYFKCENTCISITFNEYSETEEIIEIIIHTQNKRNMLIYKLDNDIDRMLVWNETKLNGELVHASNYRSSISKCDSIKELSNLKKQIDENKSNIKNNMKNISKVDYVYELENKKQFTTFEDAFREL